MDRTIIHVDMDAFFAAVEFRDNPELEGKPLIIGALPSERGVVSTCSYEARKYGIHSAMSIKEAYKRCPNGIYMHPNMKKYKEASAQIHEIWNSYTDVVEYLSLDEGYLDVTHSIRLLGSARQIGHEIKEQTKKITGLTCSVGIGYNMWSAKLASEEKKPNGFFEIPNANFLKQMIMDRDVKIILGVGRQTASTLNLLGIHTVRDIVHNPKLVKRSLKKHGDQILELIEGIDNREVTPYTEPKSIGKEHTFQEDISDFEYLKDALLLTAKELSYDIHQRGIYCSTVTLKVTYGDMQKISRSQTGESTNRADEIYRIAASLLDTILKRPVRLIGISLSNLSNTSVRQMTFMDNVQTDTKKEKLDSVAFQLQKKFGKGAVKTGNELTAEKRLKDKK